MKYQKFLLAASAASLMVAQSVFAQEAATPSNNTLKLQLDQTEQTIENIPAYLYEDSNYFMLRDIGRMVGYDVSWDDSAKEITLKKNAEARDLDALSKAADAETVTSAKQTLVIDGTTYADVDCLTIDGYRYFKLRDLADKMGFACDWDADTNTVVLKTAATVPGVQEGTKETAETDQDKLIERFIDEDLNQERIVSNDVHYVKGSKDYSEIAAYLRENIDKDFQLSDFAVTESDLYATQYGLEGINTLDLRFQVKDVENSNFGYRVICVGDTAKLVNQIGERNPDFDLSKVKDFALSEEEAKEQAIALDASEDKVQEQTVTKFFDMNDLQCKYLIETTYMDDGGAFYTTSHEI